MLKNMCLCTFVGQEDLKSLEGLTSFLKIDKSPESVGDFMEYQKRVNSFVNEKLNTSASVNMLNGLYIELSKYKKFSLKLNKELELYKQRLCQSKIDLNDILNDIPQISIS